MVKLKRIYNTNQNWDELWITNLEKKWRIKQIIYDYLHYGSFERSPSQLEVYII